MKALNTWISAVNELMNSENNTYGCCDTNTEKNFALTTKGSSVYLEERKNREASKCV